MNVILDSLGITDHIKLFSTIGDVYRYDSGRKIIKIDNDSENIDAEHKSLLLLHSSGFNIPTIYEKSTNYIIMEFIEETLPCDKTLLLKKELEKLHSIKHHSFGQNHSTFCGSIKVPNDYYNDWCTFFKNNRWIQLLNKLKDDVLFYNAYCNMLKIHDIMHLIFEKNVFEPVLLHGDINPRNFIVKDDKIYFIDPTCYYGDKKYDHACYNIWKGIKPVDAIDTIYYIFILALGYHGSRNPKTITKINNYCVDVLETFPKIYPSLIHNIETIDSYENIVIFQGCFNPVHKNHLNTANIGRKYAESLEKYKGGTLLVLALAHDSRIDKKGSDGITLYHRKNMLILSTSSYVNTCIDFTHLWLDDITNQYRTLYPMVKNIFICCGTDGLKYPLQYCHKKQEFIVIKRNDYDFVLTNERIHYIDVETTTMSSTEIRKNVYLAKDFLDDCVYEYLLENNLVRR